MKAPSRAQAEHIPTHARQARGRRSPPIRAPRDRRAAVTGRSSPRLAASGTVITTRDRQRPACQLLDRDPRRRHDPPRRRTTLTPTQQRAGRALSDAIMLDAREQTR